MMKEIGGYIELDTYSLPAPHENAIALNSGRNALAYLFKSRGIRKIKLPYFICDSVPGVCEREGVEKSFYRIGADFRPAGDVTLADGEWLYLVNFYGQLSNEAVKSYVKKYTRVIVDHANAYYQTPLPHVDTLYTCRKWFGVADGAYLYTDAVLQEELPQDQSFDRMRFLLGRYERTAGEFYGEYSENNRFFINEPIKRMSKLTHNLLHGIDHETVQRRRTENFGFLQEKLGGMNLLSLHTAMFMYPLMIENGAEIRRRLQAEKIYIPTLWPSVFKLTLPTDTEYKMAENILPLPIDQRYDADDMEYLVDRLMECRILK